jgi:hypothetical protein
MMSEALQIDTRIFTHVSETPVTSIYRVVKKCVYHSSNIMNKIPKFDNYQIQRKYVVMLISPILECQLHLSNG